MGQAPAATHALAVLRLLAQRAAPLPAAALARELGVPRSTLYRLLAVLVEEGFVVHLAREQRYGLGLGAFELGTAYTRQEPLRWRARGPLQRLVAEIGEHGHFAMLHGRDVLYVIEERAPMRPPLVTEVGVRLPANLTASGLAILGSLPSRQVSAVFPTRAAFTRHAGGGPASPAELRAALAKVRAVHYAEENGWITEGLASVASAVIDHQGLPVGAVTITFLDREADKKRRGALAEAARATADEISRTLRPRRSSENGGQEDARPVVSGA